MGCLVSSFDRRLLELTSAYCSLSSVYTNSVFPLILVNGNGKCSRLEKIFIYCEYRKSRFIICNNNIFAVPRPHLSIYQKTYYILIFSLHKFECSNEHAASYRPAINLRIFYNLAFFKVSHKYTPGGKKIRKWILSSASR